MVHEAFKVFAVQYLYIIQKIAVFCVFFGQLDKINSRYDAEIFMVTLMTCSEL